MGGSSGNGEDWVTWHRAVDRAMNRRIPAVAIDLSRRVAAPWPTRARILNLPGRWPVVPVPLVDPLLQCHFGQSQMVWVQARTQVTVTQKDITKKVSRSSGPGGQSVNVSDTRVQLSFFVDRVNMPDAVRKKLKMMCKNKINKKGELIVVCQETS